MIEIGVIAAIIILILVVALYQKSGEVHSLERKIENQRETDNNRHIENSNRLLSAPITLIQSHEQAKGTRVIEHNWRNDCVTVDTTLHEETVDEKGRVIGSLVSHDSGTRYRIECVSLPGREETIYYDPDGLIDTRVVLYRDTNGREQRIERYNSTGKLRDIDHNFYDTHGRLERTETERFYVLERGTNETVHKLSARPGQDLCIPEKNERLVFEYASEEDDKPIREVYFDDHGNRKWEIHWIYDKLGRKLSSLRLSDKSALPSERQVFFYLGSSNEPAFVIEISNTSLPSLHFSPHFTVTSFITSPDGAGCTEKTSGKPTSR